MRQGGGSMTSPERVRKAVNHQEVDRIPLYEESVKQDNEEKTR